MKLRRRGLATGVVLIGGMLWAQDGPPTILSPPAEAQQPRQPPSDAEQQDLMKAVSEGANSPVEMVRAMEAYLAKYPNSSQKAQIYRTLTLGAFEMRDDARIVKYGVPALDGAPQDPVLLDRVTKSLLAMGDAEHARQAVKFARVYEDLLDSLPPVVGKDIARRQDERERALGRSQLYQAQARTILGQTDDAERLASRAFSSYPGEESARVWSEALQAMDRPQDAVEKLADAFSVPDQYALPAQRQDNRQKLGELYAHLHAGSQTGLGDLIMNAYDRMTTIVQTRLQRLAALDPNSVARDPLDATISGVDGKKLRLSTLKGKVVVMDFWATWCEPCRAQHPLYEQVKKQFGPRNDLVFLTIDADEDRTLVEPFLEEQMWDRQVYYEDGLGRLLEVTSIPTTVLFGKNGHISARLNGFAPSQFVEDLTERIKAALAEPAAGAPFR